MATFQVCVDITLSKNLYIEAENAERAEEIVRNRINKDPYYATGGYRDAAFVCYDITDVNEF